VLTVLKSIPESKLMSDAEWEDALKEAIPGALGFILDSISGALAIYSEVEVKEKFRLAALCKWGEAISQSMGEIPGRFMEIYGKNRTMVSRTAITLSPVGQAILDFIDCYNDEYWVGTASQLLKALNDYCEEETKKRDSEWPSNANKLSEKLNVIKLDLERANIKVDNAKNFTVRKALRKYPSCKAALEGKSPKTKIVVITKVKQKGLYQYEEDDDYAD